MLKLRVIAFSVFAVAFSTAYSQTDVTAAITNMHFNAKDIDTNHDNMISPEEMQKYAEKMWENISKGKATVPIALSAEHFATAGVDLSAKDMDTDHDGSISKEEFLAYTMKKYDGMKKTNGMVPVDIVAAALSRSNSN
jgi:Ca2+-binding EF-hand superfamily protein